MTKLPTINDVAMSAGVSRQTVSNVLNSPAIVRPATRKRVQAAIAQLGYRPHASARRLRTQRSATIAVRIDQVPDSASGSVLDRFLHNLTERADRRGLRVMLYAAQDVDGELRAIKRLVDGSDVDAFVLSSTFHGDPRATWLIEQDQTFVSFGRPWGADGDDPRHLWVDVDGHSGTRAATEHLLNHGAQRVGFLGWPEGSGTGDDRRGGWREAMLAHGFTDDQTDKLAVACEENMLEARASAQQLLSRHVDAIVATSDMLALAAMITVGGRLPVVGFDNGPIAASLGISSVDQHLGEVAENVLKLLERQDPQAPTHHIVQPELVVRESSALVEAGVL